MLVPVELISVEFLSLAPGQMHRQSATCPALYVAYTGTFLLTSAAEADFNASSAATTAIQNGDVVLVTRPMTQQLDGFRDPHLSSNEVGKCLKISFQFKPGCESLLASFPPNVTAHQVAHPGAWPAGLFSFANQENSQFNWEQKAAFQALASLLIGIVLGSVPGVRNRQQRSNFEPAVSQALLAMEREPGKSWTIERLAETVGISRSALSQKFKDQVGRTLNEHLLEVRMHLADSYLKGRRHQLKEIARLTGYQSVSAFSTAFKRWSGKSPGVHRKFPS